MSASKATPQRPDKEHDRALTRARRAAADRAVRKRAVADKARAPQANKAPA